MNETMFSGRRRGKRGWGASGKTLSLASIKETMMPFITKYTKQEVSIIQKTGLLLDLFTDSWESCGGIKRKGCA